MVLVVLDEGESRGGMKRSMSFAGTVDVGLALQATSEGENEKRYWHDLISPGLVGALAGVAMSVRAPWLFTVLGLALLVASGPRLLSTTYTYWNCTVLAGQVADRLVRRDADPRLLPFLVVNSWAIFTSFNSIAVFHRPHFSELAERLQCSMLNFHFLNTLGHFVPVVISTVWFTRLSDERVVASCAWSVVPLPIATLLFHMLWALRVAGGLLLDNVYLKRPKFHWYIAWLVSAVTHVSVGIMVNLKCNRANAAFL